MRPAGGHTVGNGLGHGDIDHIVHGVGRILGCPCNRGRPLGQADGVIVGVSADVLQHAVVMRNVRVDIVQEGDRRGRHHDRIGRVERAGGRWPTAVMDVDIRALLSDGGPNRNIGRPVAVGVGPGLACVDPVGNRAELLRGALVGVVHEAVAIAHHLVTAVLFA